MADPWDLPFRYRTDLARGDRFVDDGVAVSGHGNVWRYGFLGLGAGYLQTPTLGLLLIAATALWQGDLGLARGVGRALMVSAVVLLLAVALFMLDVVQVRQLQVAEAQTGVLYGGLLQAVKYVLASIILAATGLGLIQSVKTARSQVSLAPARAPLIGSAAAPSMEKERPQAEKWGRPRGIRGGTRRCARRGRR